MEEEFSEPKVKHMWRDKYGTATVTIAHSTYNYQFRYTNGQGKISVIQFQASELTNEDTARTVYAGTSTNGVDTSFVKVKFEPLNLFQLLNDKDYCKNCFEGTLTYDMITEWRKQAWILPEEPRAKIIRREDKDSLFVTVKRENGKGNTIAKIKKAPLEPTYLQAYVVEMNWDDSNYNGDANLGTAMSREGTLVMCTLDIGLLQSDDVYACCVMKNLLSRERVNRYKAEKDNFYLCPYMGYVDGENMQLTINPKTLNRIRKTRFGRINGLKQKRDEIDGNVVLRDRYEEERKETGIFALREQKKLNLWIAEKEGNIANLELQYNRELNALGIRTKDFYADGIVRAILNSGDLNCGMPEEDRPEPQ